MGPSLRRARNPTLPQDRGPGNGTDPRRGASHQPGVRTAGAAAADDRWGVTTGRTREGEEMTTFSVWKFDEPAGAAEAEAVLPGGGPGGLVTVVDHAVVEWPNGAGRPTTRYGGDD